VSPFDGTSAREPESVDRERRYSGTESEKRPLEARRRHRLQVFATASKTHPGPRGEFVVETGVCEIHAEQRAGEFSGKPHLVDRERLISGETQPLKVEKWCVSIEREVRGSIWVTSNIEGTHDVALLVAGGLDRLIEAVERAERLLDLDVDSEPGASSSSGDDDAVSSQPADGVTHGVPRDPVLRDERHLAWERVGELAPVRAPPEIVEQLCPEWQWAVAIDGPAWRTSHHELWSTRAVRLCMD
jgi:hypothetical protein